LTESIRARGTHNPLIEPVAVQVGAAHAPSEFSFVVWAGQGYVRSVLPKRSCRAARELTTEDGVGSAGGSTEELGLPCADQDIAGDVPIDICHSEGTPEGVARYRCEDSEI
jgi:hypothetical protein